MVSTLSTTHVALGVDYYYFVLKLASKLGHQGINKGLRERGRGPDVRHMTPFAQTVYQTDGSVIFDVFPVGYINKSRRLKDVNVFLA